jgi:hypothetical protein
MLVRDGGIRGAVIVLDQFGVSISLIIGSFFGGYF